MTTERRWVVGATGGVLGDVLTQLGVEHEAVTRGQVFIGSKRVDSLQLELEPGAEVVIREENVTSATQPAILQRFAGFVAVNKPAGVVAEPDRTGADHSLLHWLARELDAAVADCHIHQRLDRQVSGALLASFTASGREALLRSRVERTYVAFCSPAPTRSSGTWNEPIGRVGRGWGVGGRNSRPASTTFAVLDETQGVALLRLQPSTGRTHQLRIHAAAAGVPLLGDREHGGVRRLTDAAGRVRQLDRVALHSLELKFGAEAKQTLVRSELPTELSEWWRWLGGGTLKLDMAPRS